MADKMILVSASFADPSESYVDPLSLLEELIMERFEDELVDEVSDYEDSGFSLIFSSFGIDGEITQNLADRVQRFVAQIMTPEFCHCNNFVGPARVFLDKR